MVFICAPQITGSKMMRFRARCKDLSVNARSVIPGMKQERSNSIYLRIEMTPLKWGCSITYGRNYGSGRR